MTFGPTLSHLLAQGRAGFLDALTFNPIKFLPVVLLYLLWVKIVSWANKDTRDNPRLVDRREFWNSALFWPGVVALGVIFIVPEPVGLGVIGWVIWGVKLLIAAAFVIVPAWIYIWTRNKAVPLGEEVTLRTIYADTLALFGVYVRRTPKKKRIGPPIHFVTSGGSKYEVDPSAVEDPEEATALMDAWIATKTLIYDAVKRRATDVFIEPRGQQFAVVYKIDGVLLSSEPFDAEIGWQVIRNLKTMAGLNPNELRKPQEGKFVAVTRKAETPVRVETRGTRVGERVHLELYVEAAHPENLEDLGMRPDHVEMVRKLAASRAGVILVGAPPESGKTTTAHAVLRAVDRYMRNVVTLEDEVEYTIEAVARNKLELGPGETPFTKLRSIVRTEPDVIMVDELRDPEQAQLIAKAAHERLFIVTLTATDAISAIVRFCELVGDPKLAAMPLLGVVSCRLVRRLCDECKEPYQPNPQLLQRLNIPAGRVQYFYKPPEPPEKPEEVCEKCSGLGYYGRIGVFEVLVVNDALRQAIASRAHVNVLKTEARKAGLVYLQEDALRQVVLGVTSLQEVRRAFTQPQAAATMRTSG